MGGTSACCICMALLFALFACASAQLKIGIVSSMTGSLTDWNSTLAGERLSKMLIFLTSLILLLIAGYLFWQKGQKTSLAIVTDSLTDTIQKTMKGVMPIKGNSSTVNFNFTVTVLDDESNDNRHETLITDLLNNNTDFILNAQPSFAAKENAAVRGGRQKLSIHAVTTNSALFNPAISGIFNLAPSASTFTDALFQSYKLNSFTNIVFLQRTDNDELNFQCKTFVDSAKALLLNAIVKPYTASDNLTTIALAINGTSFDALVGCMTSSEAAFVYSLFDQWKKPIKSVFFTQGPTNQTWANNIVAGSTSASQILSAYAMGPAMWGNSLPNSYGGSEPIFKTASQFSSSFQAEMGFPPDDRAAAGAAAGLVLYTAVTTAFEKCVIPSNGDVFKLLYDPTGISCSDGINDGMSRVINSVKNVAINSFFGNIAFDRFGQNYLAISAVAQISSATVNFASTNLPFIVSPASLAAKIFTVPQPNHYKGPCPLGYYANSYTDYLPCIPCPGGTYSDIIGATSCQLAAKGSYSDTVGAAQQKSCPANTDTEGKGSDSITACYCVSGYYSTTKKTGSACLPCPTNNGAISSSCAGNTSWPQPIAGYYAEANAPFTMFNCNPNLLCKGGNLSNVCAPGYTKRMCAYCEPGYFLALNRCHPCPSNPNLNILYMAIMFIGYIFINLGTVRYIEAFHFGVGFCQLLAILNMFNTNWPANVQTLFNYASVLAFETNIVQPQCVNPSWFYPQNLVTQLLMPLVITACTLLWLMVTWFMFKIKMVASGKDSNLSGAGAMSFAIGSEAGSTKSKNSFASFGAKSLKALSSNTWMIALQAWFHVPASPAEMLEVIYDRLAIPTMFLNASYLANLLLCLQAFYCYDFMGVQYMYYNPTEVCYSPAHYSMMMIAAAGLIFYIFGYYVFLAVVMRHLRKTRSFGEKVPLLLFGWIYERYKAELFWYELVSLLQRTCFVVIAVFALLYPDIQLLACFGIEAIVLLTDVRFVPFIDEVSHYMNHTCDVIVLITTVIGIMFYNPLELPSTIFGMEVFLYVMIGLNFFFLLVVIFYDGFLTAYLAILKNKHSKIAKKWGHSVRRYKAMYNVFSPLFMFQWLTKARVDDWQEWHKLCVMVADYARPTSEVSWLSHKKIARFWRYLLANFPEVLDFLLSVDDEQRNAFSTFIDVMYEHFFESGEDNHSQLHQIVSGRYAAPVGLFLANASEQDIAFFQRVLKNAFEKVKGKEGARQITLAMSRSKSQHSMTNLADKALRDSNNKVRPEASVSQVPLSPKPPILPPSDSGIGRNSSRNNVLTLESPTRIPSMTSPIPMVSVEGSVNSMTLPQPPNPASPRPSRLAMATTAQASTNKVEEFLRPQIPVANAEAEELVAEEMMNEIEKASDREEK